MSTSIRQVHERIVTGAWRRVMERVERGVLRSPEIGIPLTTAQRASVPRRPLLLFGGYGNSADAMDAFARSFRRDGYGADQVFALTLPGFGMGPTEQVAADVRSAVEQVLRATGATDVDVVAHSRIGAMARWALIHPPRGAAPLPVHRLVTLHTANQGMSFGSRIADRAITPVLPLGMRELMVQSPFIRELQQDAVHGAEIVAVGSRGWDHLVVPTSSQRMPSREFVPDDAGRVRHGVSTVGHYSLLTDGPTYEAVRGVLLRPDAG